MQRSSRASSGDRKVNLAKIPDSEGFTAATSKGDPELRKYQRQVKGLLLSSSLAISAATGSACASAVNSSQMSDSGGENEDEVPDLFAESITDAGPVDTGTGDPAKVSGGCWFHLVFKTVHKACGDKTGCGVVADPKKYGFLDNGVTFAGRTSRMRAVVMTEK